MTSIETKKSIQKIQKLVLAVIAIISLNVDFAHANYPDSVIASNPVLYYRFNEGSGTGLSNSATGSNAVTQTATAGTTLILGSGTPGPRPPAYLGLESDNLAGIFSGGTGSQVSLSGSGGLYGSLSGKSGITISTWINPSTLPTGSSEDVFFQLRNGVGSTGLQLSLKSGVISMAGRSQNGDSFSSNSSTYTLSTGTWYQITGVWDFSIKTMTLYVNGISLGSYSASGWGSSAFNITTSTSNPILIGSSASSSYFHGALDEFAIYNSALSASQISALYNAAVVPEPTAAHLLLGAVGSLAWFLRRRRHLSV